MPSDIALCCDPDREVDEAFDLAPIYAEAVVSRSTAATALNRELARTGALVASRPEPARPLTPKAGLGNRRSEVSGAIAFGTVAAPHFAGPIASKARFCGTLEAPASLAPVANALVLSRAMTRFAFQGLRARPLAPKTRAVVVDWTDRV